ncbi:MAG TPA: AmmeMemoRadiSam system protein B [Syntrophales bacterium]|nr:AmmeMemoRadiSam system protein B [Syntrophales bacterium]
MEKPVLRRDIQPIATTVNGRQVIVFHDPYHLTDHGIAIDIKTLPILQLLDGKHDLRDIQIIMMKQQGGRMVYISEIESFIETLDGACLLNSEFFNNKMSNLRDDFNSRQSRLPVHAGKSYAAEPDKLALFIQDVENNLNQDNSRYTGANITGILAPHIDIKVAKETYINSYRCLKNRTYDLVVIFGINHHEQDGLYCVSEKNYVTPFGEIKTDRNFISDLKSNLPEGTLTKDDFGHMTEHSIEFQTIFLQHYLREPFSIVTILCGGIHEFIHQKKSPLTDEKFRGMVHVMKEVMQKRKNRILIAAGVDLSHVGRKFGDQLPADAILPQATTNDKKILSFLTRGEAESVFLNAVETQDKYRVCGLPAILLFASLFAESRADILHFETYHERETHSAVNYASLIFSSESV